MADKKKAILLIGDGPGLAVFASMFEQVTNMPMVEAIDRRLDGESEQSILQDITQRIKDEVKR